MNYGNKQALCEWANRELAKFIDPDRHKPIFVALEEERLSRIDLGVLRIFMLQRIGKWKPEREEQSERQAESNFVTKAEVAKTIKCSKKAVGESTRKFNDMFRDATPEILQPYGFFLFGPEGITYQPTLFDCKVAKAFSVKQLAAQVRALQGNADLSLYKEGDCRAREDLIRALKSVPATERQAILAALGS